MKPIIIPVENGKVTLTLADFRKYMEEAYSQGYSDGCNVNTLITNPGNPYWWRDSWYCSTGDTATLTNPCDINTTLTNATTEGTTNVAK